MKHVAIVVGLALSLAAQAPARAQGKPDFSGTWIFNQGKSSANTAGNSPVLPFPSEIVVKQTPTELHVASSTVRQKPVTAVYKLDGGKVTIDMSGGVSETSEARLDGAKVLITSRRTFPSPIGEVVVNFKETWSLDGSMLTIEKTRSTDLDTATAKAAYDKK